MILDKPFPPDIRVEKEARSLRDAGFDVLVLSAPGPEWPPREVWQGITVIRANIPAGGGWKSKVGRVLERAIFVQPFWKRAIRDFTLEYRPDALHVHDLFLVNTALLALEGRRLPVIADLHENVPAYMQIASRHQAPLGVRLTMRIFGGRARWDRHEKAMCDSVDHVIAVVDEMKDRLIEHHDLDPEKVTVVTNTEERDFAREAQLEAELLDKYAPHFTLAYIGGFAPHRGLDTAILGAALLKKEIPNLRLLLVGKGNHVLEEHLQKLVQENDLQGVVEIIAQWQPFARIPSFIKAASVGLVPHASNDHTDNTIPHKLFQYMSMGLPVLVSSCKPLARVVGETGCGLVFEASNPGDFARKALDLFRNEEARKQMGVNGERATLHGEWNWCREGEKLVRLYREFLQDRP